MTTLTAPDVGQMAPDFALKAGDGQLVTLSEYRGKRPIVLAFYPLAFSPTCSHQLPTIERDLARIRALGAEVLGISVDSHYANAEFARKLQLSFPLLSDFKREASTAYGMLLDSGYSGRALFVVGRDGRIAYRDIAPAPGDIPSNAELLRALEKLPR
ncbi:MAG TPA: redoxin domain-containing protein [Dongiaceae bacterium]|nr:redoxin domain-containing protein [Dongiaceae bacterium]